MIRITNLMKVVIDRSLPLPISLKSENNEKPIEKPFQRAAAYSKAMTHLGQELYKLYLRKVKENYGWRPRIHANPGASSFPLF